VGFEVGASVKILSRSLSQSSNSEYGKILSAKEDGNMPMPESDCAEWFVRLDTTVTSIKSANLILVCGHDACRAELHPPFLRCGQCMVSTILMRGKVYQISPLLLLTIF
jgi:hypothetical protein